MDYTFYQAEDFAVDETFIQYYLKSDLAAVDFWEQWIRLHPEMLDEVVTAEHLLNLVHVRLPQAEFETEMQRMRGFLQMPESTTSLPSPEQGKKQLFFSPFWNTKTWALAAMVTLLITLGFWLATVAPSASENPDWITTFNPPGRRSIIQLPDGSSITLNANSSLTYPKRFVGATREVKLEGEAFFEIAKNTQQPFLVRTGALTTTVLGTKFNLKVLTAEKKTEVALVEGSVKVNAKLADQEILLAPNQLLTYSEETKDFHLSALALDETIGWKDGVLLFKSDSFPEIAAKVKTMYGITLVNQAKKTNWQYSGRFQNQSYLSVVQSICYAKRLSYTIKQDTVIVH